MANSNALTYLLGVRRKAMSRLVDRRYLTCPHE